MTIKEAVTKERVVKLGQCYRLYEYDYCDEYMDDLNINSISNIYIVNKVCKTHSGEMVTLHDIVDGYHIITKNSSDLSNAKCFPSENHIECMIYVVYKLRLAMSRMADEHRANIAKLRKQIGKLQRASCIHKHWWQIKGVYK